MRKIPDETADKMIEGVQLLLEGTQILNEAARKLSKLRIPPPVSETLAGLRQQMQTPAKAEQFYNLRKLLIKAQDELSGE